MFKKLYDWTQSNRARFGEIGVTFTAVWLWVMLVTTFLAMLTILGITSADGGEGSRLFKGMLPLGMQSFADTSLTVSLIGSFLGACVMAPLIEETFRAGLCELCGDKDGNVRHLFLLLAGSFLGFGLLHGGGYFSIFIQGSLGLLLGRLWFRTLRGPDGKLNKAWAYGANVFVHAAYNFSLFCFQVYMVRSQMG